MFSDAIWWRHNKSNMADGRHIENHILAISQRFIVRLTRNVVRWSTIMFGQVTKLTIFENWRWQTAAILKIVSSLYLSRGSSDFNEIWCAAADFGFKDRHVTKYQNIVNSKMADGRHIENRLLAISPRFIVRLTRNFVWSKITFRHRSPKYQILKIQDGGQPLFEK